MNIEVRFYDEIADERLKFAVILARYGGKWVFCKHKERQTLEIPGGHREPGETVEQAAYDQIMKEKQQGYSYGGRHTYGGYSSGNGSDPIELKAAANYIANRHYAEALNALGAIEPQNRGAQWYYFSAVANMGLGNNVTAKQHIEQAVRLEPSNMEYRQFMQHLAFGGTWYQSMGQGYERPYAGTGNWCLSMLFLNMLCNCCFRPC